jgi:Zn finger protein HypA/HybF involved in hydrogenase expression
MSNKHNKSKTLSKSEEKNKLHEVEIKVQEVTNVMHSNIEKALESCDKLAEIEEKSIILEKEANKFKQKSTSVRRHFQCQSYKQTLLITIVILIILGIIIGIIYSQVK